jgi:type IV secretory pathway VirD2 relaxase
MAEGGEDDFRVRPGRIRSPGSAGLAKTFLGRMARSMSQAGPPRGRGGAGRARPRAGGQRRVIVKARIIRMSASSAGALRAHLSYIRRDAANPEEDRGRVFNAASDDENAGAFAENAAKDRHHFRFIVSPEDGPEMVDLKPFVRDLVGQMEEDLGTRLDWVAAVHDDTAHPHAHIVIRGRRDDGRDLVMPRAYISHGLRGRAEDLVTLELGPETMLEAQRKLAREASAHRLTRLDRFLLRQAGPDRTFALAASAPQYRAVHAARLKTLERLGLAEKQRAGVWQLSEGMERTLRDLGERGDIVKAMNRAIAGREGRRFDADAIIDRGDPDGRSITGAVLAKGMRGDGHDRPYVILDGVDGRAVYAEVADTSLAGDLKPGMIVSLSPASTAPKPADHVIAHIADANGGVYSASLHQQADPGASPDYVAAHIRRLEALRRAGHAARSPDGTWTVGADYLERAETYQRAMASRQPLIIQLESRLDLPAQTRAAGVTWLDQTEQAGGAALGFGGEVATARQMRRAFLVEIGVLSSAGQAIGNAERSKLREMDLDAAGAALAQQFGKGYSRAPVSGRIEGVYRDVVDRPSGRFAVIDRGTDFTLVPWRAVMERNRGLMVAGSMQNGAVSWKLTKGRGIGG